MLSTRKHQGSVLYELRLTAGPVTALFDRLCRSINGEDGEKKAERLSLTHELFSLKWTWLFLPWKFLCSDLDCMSNSQTGWLPVAELSLQHLGQMFSCEAMQLHRILYQLRQIPTSESSETINISQMLAQQKHSISTSTLHFGDSISLRQE